MKIWLVTIGESLPIDGEDTRLLRTGVLASELVKRGHTVRWWTSTIDHFLKKQRFPKDTVLQLKPNYTLHLIHAMRYKKNISWQRILNHYQLGYRFLRLASREEKPDVILCAAPPTELCTEVLKYAKKNQVPIIFDVRDVWPDVFTDLCPKHWAWIFALKLTYEYLKKKNAKLYKECDGVIAVSDAYLDWALLKAGRARSEKDAVFQIGYSRPDFDQNQFTVIEKHFKSLGLDVNKTVYWFIGTFGHCTDLDTVIETARKLQERGIDGVQFALCGDGENYGRWIEKAKGLSNVIFPGWINNRQIFYLMHPHHIGLAAYSAGAAMGLPNKIFEYMSAGLPILCSLTGEAKDLIMLQECGLYYEAGDSENLFSKVMTFHQNPGLRKKMGENALRLYEGQYSADRVYPAIIEYLANVSTAKTAAVGCQV